MKYSMWGKQFVGQGIFVAPQCFIYSGTVSHILPLEKCDFYNTFIDCSALNSIFLYRKDQSAEQHAPHTRVYLLSADSTTDVATSVKL